MPWYIFAAITPTLYSITNFVEKYLLEKKIREPIAITSLAGIASGILGIVIGIFTGFQNVGLTQTFLLLFAGILLIFYLLPYFAALKLEDTSRIVPLFQFIPVFTLILSSVFLKESLTAKQITGLFLVVVAGVVISVEKIETGIFKPRKALWFMLLAGFMYGMVGILFRFVAKETGFWTTLSYEYMGTGLGAVILLSFPRVRINLRSQAKQIQSSLRIIVVNNSIATAAQVSESYALSLAAVPLVHLIGGIQPLIVLFIGLALSLWFPYIVKEDIGKIVVVHKLISIVFIFIGLYLVYF